LTDRSLCSTARWTTILLRQKWHIGCRNILDSRQSREKRYTGNSVAYLMEKKRISDQKNGLA
ncbi:MAG: hypothetical protein OXD44_02275, partial [Gammaproteobacteria bacterium]|nr:hypothetical protein [Gammaproteobacteria bacterium]